jgi:hypothetical protein
METAVAEKFDIVQAAVADLSQLVTTEAEQKERARIEARFERLWSIGMSMAGGMYRLPWNPEGMALPEALIKTCTDEQFESFSSRSQGMEKYLSVLLAVMWMMLT